MKFNEAQIQSNIIKSLAHPVRLMIVDALSKVKEANFMKVYELFELDKSTVSKHLTILKQSGIISARKKGTDMIFKLETPCIMKFFECVQGVIKSNIDKQKKCLGKC